MSKRKLLIASGAGIFIALISFFIMPSSFILRAYPDENDFDLLARFFCANATEHQNEMVHVGTENASYIPKPLLPRLVYERKKLCRNSVRISAGKPSTRIEVFSDGATSAGKIMRWYVLEGRVVGFSIENNGVQTHFDVIEFTQTARQWMSFLKATVDSVSPATSTINEEEIRVLCRDRYGWGDIQEAFGRPTISLSEMNAPLLARIRPKPTAYRVTMVNPEFVHGAGPMSKTVSCVVQGERLLFLETDTAVVDFLDTSEILPTSPTEVLEFIQTFLALRGFELQIGAPSKHNPWAVKIEDYFWDLSPTSQEERDSSKWNIVLDHAEDGWAVEFTGVSPDSYECFRYRMLIPRSGNVVLENAIMVYRPVIFV
jgi:hypothetical protein